MAVFYIYVILGIPIVLFLHEIGHLAAARWCGVGVLRLSLGLGPEIFGFDDRRGTRWALALVPVGASLEMCNEQNASGMPGKRFAATEMLSQKSLGQRALIYAAGPLANILLALSIYLSALLLFGETAFLDIDVERPDLVAAMLLCGFSILVAGFQLIPLPPLDGGWLVLILVEALTGRPPSKSGIQALRRLGISFLIALEMLAIGYGIWNYSILDWLVRP